MGGILPRASRRLSLQQVVCLVRRWEGWLPLVMRQSHAGGGKLFVDYAGDTAPVVVDRRKGEILDVRLFVAVLGGSSLSFAYAT